MIGVSPCLSYIRKEFVWKPQGVASVRKQQVPWSSNRHRSWVWWWVEILAMIPRCAPWYSTLPVFFLNSCTFKVSLNVKINGPGPLARSCSFAKKKLQAMQKNCFWTITGPRLHAQEYGSRIRQVLLEYKSAQEYAKNTAISHSRHSRSFLQRVK